MTVLGNLTLVAVRAAWLRLPMTVLATVGRLGLGRGHGRAVRRPLQRVASWLQ
jgi:hypothetical protein